MWKVVKKSSRRRRIFLFAIVPSFLRSWRPGRRASSLAASDGDADYAARAAAAAAVVAAFAGEKALDDIHPERVSLGGKKSHPLHAGPDIAEESFFNRRAPAS